MNTVRLLDKQSFSKWISTLLICALLISLAACSEKSRQLARLKQDAVILAFGDSLTAGVGVDKSHSYPSVLARLTGRKVINAGISGELSAAGVKRLAGVIADTAPQLMVLLLGGNDILRNYNLAQTKANLSKMIDHAEQQGVQVVLIGLPQKQLFSDVAPLYRELAEEHQLVFEPELIADLLRKRSMKSDMVHFNKAGYQAMAESIYQLLKNHGAL